MRLTIPIQTDLILNILFRKAINWKRHSLVISPGTTNYVTYLDYYIIEEHALTSNFVHYVIK
jgi:hypothetical protein